MVKKVKKSPFAYNNRYADGYQILQGVRERNALTSSAIQEPYNTGSFQTVSTEDAPELSFYEKYGNYPELDEDGNVLQKDVEDENDIPYYKRPLKWVSDFVKNTADDWNNAMVSPADVWRQTLYKGFEAHLGSIQTKQMNNKWEIESLDEAQMYLDQITKVQQLTKELELSKSRQANSTWIDNIDKQLQSEISKLNSIEKDIQNKWRDSDSFLRMFTNFGKIDAEQDENGLNWGWRAIKPTRRNEAHGFWDTTKAVVGDVGSFLTNTFSNLGYSIGDVLHLTSDKAATVRNIIKNTDKNDTFINQYFKGYKSVNNIDEYKNNVQNMINILKKDRERESKELEASQLSTINTLRNGNWAFDPRKIDPIYKKKQEENDSSLIDFLNPLRLPYAIPEMGSSYSDLQTSLAMLGTEQGFAWAGELLNPGKKGKLAMGLLGMGTGLAIAKRLREEETGSEVSDAYTQRLVEELYKNRSIDANKVLDSINNFAKALGGLEFNPDELDLQKKMALALSYNIKTGDPIFDKFSVDARNGLKKIYNENMSLSTMDYIEAIPFMNYTRSVMKEMAGAPLSKLMSKLGGTKVGAFTSKAADKYRTVTQAMADKTITKLFGKGFEKTAAKLRTLHALQWVKSLAKKGMFTGFVEGVEEGQQQLLQSRYMRGEYDDYDSPYFDSTLFNPATLFDIPSSIKDLELGTAALGCYLGINFGDPDNGDAELRKAMTTGAVTGMMFSGLHALGISNLQRAHMDPNNLRALHRQFQNDAVLAKMVGENYGAAQDDAHIATFFGAMDKRGLNRSQLEKSLNDFKRFKGEMVKDEYIDRDIDLLNNTYFAYNNNATNDILNNLNIRRGSDDHLKVVQNAVRAFMDYDTLSDKIKDQRKRADELSTKINSIVDFYLDEKKDEGAVPEDIKNLRTSLKPIIDELRKQYTQYQLEAKANNDIKKQDLLNNSEFIKKVKDEFKYDDKIKDADSEEAKSKVNEEYQKKLDETINSQLSISDEKSYVNSSLNMVFEARKAQQIKKILDLFDSRHKIAKEIEREFGIDLNADRLANVVDNMREVYKNITSENNKKLKSENNRRDELNKLIEKLNSQIDKENSKNKNKKGYVPKKKHNLYKKATIQSIVKDLDPLLGDTEEYNSIIKSIFINNAVLKLYQPYMEAYSTGQANPYDVKHQTRPLRWSELSKDQQEEYANKLRKKYEEEGKDTSTLTQKRLASSYNYEQSLTSVELEKLTNRQKKLIDDFNHKDEQDRTALEEFQFSEEIKDIRSKAAQQLIEDDLNKKRERQRIAHREFLQDGGLTTDDIDNAENGDKQSGENVREATSEKENDTTSESTTVSPESSTPVESYETPVQQQNNPGLQSLIDRQVPEQSSVSTDEDSLVATDTSIEDLVDEQISGKPKPKPKQAEQPTKNEEQPISSEEQSNQKPVTKADIVDNSEKPGVAAAAKVDIPGESGMENDDQKSGETKVVKNPEDNKTPEVTDQNKSAKQQVSRFIDDLINGNYDLDGLRDLPEGELTLGDKILIIDKNNETTLILVADGNTKNHVAIKLPSGYTTADELLDDQFVVAILINGQDYSAIISNSLDREVNPIGLSKIVKLGVQVDPKHNMNNPDTIDKNIDKNTGNEKQSPANDEVDNDISDQQEGSSQPEDTSATTAPITTNSVESIKPATEEHQLDVDDNNNVLIDGTSVSDELEMQLDTQNALLDAEYTESVEIGGGIIVNDGQYDEYDIVQNTDQAKRDYLSQTFFYNNREFEQPPFLRRDGTDIKLKYKLHTGRELAQNLAKKGWFESTEKFYVVGNALGEGKSNTVDQLTVALVLYDHKNEAAYATFLRAPYGSALTKLRNDLLSIGLDTNKFKYYHEKYVTSAFIAKLGLSNAEKLTTEQLLARARMWYNRSADLNGNRGKNIKPEFTISREDQRTIDNQARRDSENGRARILTIEEIDDNINKLIQSRKQIIEAYCTKNADGTYNIPETVRTDVRPKDPRISNGSIKARPKLSDKTPAFHVIFGKENGLGIDQDIIDIQQQIKSGKIQFGFGKGMYGNPAFGIASLDGSVYYNGRGLAGKLYLIFKGNRSNVPIMLREARFNKIPNGNGQFVKLTEQNLTLSINPTDGTYDPSNSPSAAETLLYLLTGRLNEKYYPNQDKMSGQAFCNLFINNGEKTTHTTKNTTRALNRFSYYAKKQLSWDTNENTGKPELTIVLPDDYGNLVQQHFTSEQLFSNNQQAESDRRRVVLAIANNMHFNTSLDQLTNQMNPTILNALSRHFKNNPQATSFSFGGNQVLSFNKADLFNEDGSKKNVSVLAWMIATGKLMSDTAQVPLQDPFVFASGVEQSQSKKIINSVKDKTGGKGVNGEQLPSGVVSAAAAANPKEKPTKTTKSKKQEREAFPNERKKHVSERFGLYKGKVYEGVLFADTEESRRALLSNFDDPDDGKLRDQLMIDLSDEVLEHPTPKSVEDEIEKKLNEYFESTGFKASEIEFDGIFNSLNKRMLSQSIPYVQVRNNGKVWVALKNIRSELIPTVRNSTKMNTKIEPAAVTGVFSDEKGDGKFNEKKARKWLADTLGISDSKIIVLNGILRSLHGKEVYGVMRQSIDSVNEAVFLFSDEAGEGVEYHEAWHYVNLLLHTERTRNAIYKAYCEKHPEFKNRKFREVEEALAEEYRKYAIMRNSKDIGNTIKRWFNNVYDFCTLNYRNKQLIRSIFNNINTGKYKNALIDKKSLEEFTARYNGAVNQAKYQIPTVDQKVIDNMQYIDSYQMFYQVAESLANKMIDYYAITRIEDIRKLKKDSFEQFLYSLRKSADKSTRGYIEDVYKNPSAFYGIVQQAFMQYGVSIKIKKLKQLKQDEQGKVVTENKEEEQSGQVDIGERADNTWDVFQFGESKKDNVANRAKLFLTHLQKARLEIDPENPENKVLYYEQDELLRTPVYVPFGEAWTKITSELWDIESYAAIDKEGHYLPTSLRGKVQSRAKYEWFYRVLDEKLNELDGDSTLGIDPDIEMQNQIYATVKSQQAQMAQIWLDDKEALAGKEKQRRIAEEQMDDIMSLDNVTTMNKDESIDDIDRSWQIINDNGLRAKRSLPRQWSNSAILSGLVTYDSNRKATVINLSFVSQIKRKFDEIEKAIKVKYATEDAYETAYNNVCDTLIDMLQYMCIPCDTDTLEYLIDKNIGNRKVGNIINRFNTLKQLLNNTTSGSISDIVKMLYESRNKQELTVGKGKSKDVQNVYTGYKIDSQICMIAEAYNSIHPASQDFSVKGPDGSMHYPISQNNHMSDAIRQLNIDQEAVNQKMRSPYAKNSLLFNIAKDLDPNGGKETRFVLNAFIGIKDNNAQDGKDYFGITNIEDYIAKMQMTFNNMLTLPTMADKKTWYAIQQALLKLPHDLITYGEGTQDGSIKHMRFSNNTLDIFAGYFIDELSSLEQYYSRENIAYLKKNKNALRDNFHAKFKYNDKIGEERFEFGGNGGLFRYMYDVDMSNGCNLNQYLEALYNRQREIEEHPKQYGGVYSIRDGKNELDGFELVREGLKSIRDKFVKPEKHEALRTAINDNFLMKRVNDDLRVLTANSSYKIGFMDNGKFVPDAIPSNILNWYQQQFGKAGMEVGIRAYSDNKMLSDYGLSAVANHVASTMISIIEVEKVFSGDPAFYKWKYQKSKKAISINYKGTKFQTEVRILKEKDSDKIKRLGALLSPGDNIRTDYSNSVKNNEQLRGVFGDKYTVLNINDFQLKSKYFDIAKRNFARQSAIEILRLGIRNKKDKWLKDYLSKHKYSTAEDLFTKMYQDFSVYDDFMNVDNHAKEYKSDVETFVNYVDKMSEMSVSPYGEINISDAQVIIRPELYRKIRIGIGRWSFEEDETGYSDEKAYRILEEDGSWMTDDEKAAIVSKLQLFPLKMSYFQNDSTILSSGEGFENRINLPIYNKMAIFPMFKYMTRSATGSAIYDRMNRKNNAIDMIVFESAVKVGDNQNRLTPYKNLTDDPGKNFNFDDLNKESDKYLDDNNNVVSSQSADDKLAISIQSLNGLRMQLNTDAHEAESRGIGSQMFKIAFSNILDNASYCIDKKDKDGNLRSYRKGRDIKYDIMSCVNALTYKGARSVEKEFDIRNGIVNRNKAQDYVRRVTRSNGLGYPSQDIVDNYGTAASLTSRLVFEQGVSSLVNGEVVKINTKGGSAVQQSIFGLTGFNKENIAGQDETQGFYDEDGYHVLNGGKEIQWIAKNNTMEVMLSINFFRAILPKELRNASYKVRRQWLIDHDVLYGTKSSSYDKFSEKDEKQNEINKALKHRVEYEVNIQDNVLKLTDAARTFLDNAHEKDDNIKDGRLYKYEDLINNDWSKYEGYTEDIQKEIDRLLTWNNLNKNSKYKEVKPIKTQSNPMPIGIGYRIPTQGMSSMFGFICADVLPEQSGDLIIVPREFTAQTGSDFDIDKLFIAMMSYTDGVYDDLTKEQYDKIQEIYKDKQIRNKAKEICKVLQTASDGAVQNRLLQNYLDIITDIRNFDNARASIDTITAKIKKELLPLLQTQSTEYRDGGYELTPAYQLRRKMEFTTGKDGIGPFALNITNMALTQFVKLTMRYTEGVSAFKLGDLYEITGQDGLRIADWLSAMVNAHVDVAKDPYIFDMNINSATYMYTNFLLRAGKGLSTFTFLAQPAIKELAELMQNDKGMYGNNIKSRKTAKFQKKKTSFDKVAEQYTAYLQNKLDNIDLSKITDKNEDAMLLQINYATQLLTGLNNNAISKAILDDGHNITNIDFYNAAIDFLMRKSSAKDNILFAKIKDANGNSTGQFQVDRKIAYMYLNYAACTIMDQKSTLNKTPKKISIYNIEKQLENIFNLDYAKQILQNPYSLKGLVHQLLCLQAWNRLRPYAQELSDLVKVSRIDTEKFGNNIAAQTNFKNTFNNFKYGNHNAQWYIAENGQRMNKEQIDQVVKQKGTSYALRKYFGDTFLDSKLHLATNLTQTILRSQLFTATDEFNELFTSFLCAVNGSKELNVEKPNASGGFTTETQLGYKDVYDENTIKSLSQALDNIMRYYVLRNAIGVKYNPADFNYSTFVGPIDFTCGNDIDKVQNYMHRIMFGDPNATDAYGQNDIFKNVSILLDKLQHYETKGEDVKNFAINSGLLDMDGKLSNEFLSLLRPQTASAKFPVGRMLLAKSSYGITGQEESKLVSAFNDLLENNDPTIRRLARDLAFYAYYSSYDTNGVHSFFKFVPAYYRQQYDKVLKFALLQNQTNLENMLRNVRPGSPNGSINGTLLDEVIDVICRNYWRDDNLVPVCNVYHSTKDLNHGARIVTLHPGNITYTNPGELVKKSIRVDGAIITDLTGSSPFIKVHKGNQWILYKRIGELIKSNGKSSSQFGIYSIIQKRGLHEGGINQYEFNIPSDGVSMFSQNGLPDTLSLKDRNGKQGILNTITKYIETQTKEAEKDENGMTYQYIPTTRAYLSFAGYYQTQKNDAIIRDNLTSDDGKIKFNYVNDVNNDLSKRDFVINLTSDDTINQSLQNIKDQVKADGSQKSYNIAVIGQIDSESITDSAINKYIDWQVDQYKEFLLSQNSNMNKQALEININNYRKSMDRTEVQAILQQIKIDNKVKPILDTVFGMISVFSVSSDGKPGVGEAAARYAQENSVHIESGQPAYVIMSKSDARKLGKRGLTEFIDKFSEPIDSYILSIEQESDLSTSAQVIEDASQAMNQQIQDINDQQNAAEDIVDLGDVQQQNSSGEFDPNDIAQPIGGNGFLGAITKGKNTTQDMPGTEPTNAGDISPFGIQEGAVVTDISTADDDIVNSKNDDTSEQDSQQKRGMFNQGCSNT